MTLVTVLSVSIHSMISPLSHYAPIGIALTASGFGLVSDDLNSQDHSPYLSLDQSRQCPLCKQAIGGYLQRGTSKYFLPRAPGLLPVRTGHIPSSSVRGREWGTRYNTPSEAYRVEEAIKKRRLIYAHNLYAKVSRHTFMMLHLCLTRFAGCYLTYLEAISDTKSICQSPRFDCENYHVHQEGVESLAAC